jgi:quinol monooxygenase YgiN
MAMLSDIAIFAENNEPHALAYAWFASSGDNTEVPNYYVRGFEVYEDEIALTEVHRSSAPYKKMRTSVVPEGILSKPTDLRFLQPAGIGFMNRPGELSRFQTGDKTNLKQLSFIEVLKILPKHGAKAEVLEVIKKLAVHALQDKGSTTFWALEYLPEYSDSSVLLFSVYDSRAAYDSYTSTEEISKLR